MHELTACTANEIWHSCVLWVHCSWFAAYQTFTIPMIYLSYTYAHWPIKNEMYIWVYPFVERISHFSIKLFLSPKLAKDYCAKWRSSERHHKFAEFVPPLVLMLPHLAPPSLVTILSISWPCVLYVTMAEWDCKCL